MLENITKDITQKDMQENKLKNKEQKQQQQLVKQQQQQVNQHKL